MDFKTLIAPQADSGAAALHDVKADALVVLIGGTACPPELDATLAQHAGAAAADGDFAFEGCRTLYLHAVEGVRAPRVVLVGCGAPSPAAWRKGLAAGLGALKAGGAAHVAVAAPGWVLTDAHAEQLATCAAEATYSYRLTKPSAPKPSRIERVSLVCTKAESAALGKALSRGAAVAAGVNEARELANRPANHCTPSDLAAAAKALAKGEPRLKVEVLDRKDCDKLGMGAFMAVARASHEEPRFIVLRWQGAAKKTDAPVVLVGKGITFDTGGISLKPAAEMDEMKFDMGGAASVLGTFRALVELGLELNVVGLIPACENMPGGRAVKPGDVVTSLSGQTIEILNTDAEGRLILCDALTYAERFKPACVIDIATLTGACVIALGAVRSGLFANDDLLAEQLLAAGEHSGDRAWRMPLDAEYDEALKSNFADMGNVGGRPAGSVTAAKFLQRFVGTQPWAHLDIAGTAWKSGKDKGATGRPVALLTQFLLGRARR